MNINSDVLEQIVSHLDNRAIQSLSLIPDIWNEVSQFADKSHFWFHRTEILVKRELPWMEGDWKQAYYILSDRGSWKLDNDADNHLVTEVLLLLGADPREDEAIWTSSEKGHANILRVLLRDGRADPTGCNSYPIRVAPGNGHLEVVRLLLEDGRSSQSDGCYDGIFSASKKGYTQVVSLLLRDKNLDYIELNNMIAQELDYSLEFHEVKLEISPEDEPTLLRAREEGCENIIKLLELGLRIR